MPNDSRVGSWDHGGAVCDTHAEKLQARLGNRIRFYLTDNTPILGSYTLCEAYTTGCKNPATYAFTLSLLERGATSYDLGIKHGV